MDAGKEGINKDNGDEKEGETTSLEEAREMLTLRHWRRQCGSLAEVFGESEMISPPQPVDELGSRDP